MRLALTFYIPSDKKVMNSKISRGKPYTIGTLAGAAFVPIVAYFFSGCSTGPGSTTNPNPPTSTWSILDQTTHLNLDGLSPAGSSLTVFINPGDNYLVNFTATSSSGVKSITLSGSGEVICHNNKPPYNEAKPFKYNIPTQTISLAPQPGGQVFTQAFNPFFFFWALSKGEPPSSEPAASAYTACREQVPLLGTTTYTGQATTDSGVSNPANGLSVTTCAVGLVSSPSQTCP